MNFAVNSGTSGVVEGGSVSHRGSVHQPSVVALNSEARSFKPASASSIPIASISSTSFSHREENNFYSCYNSPSVISSPKLNAENTNTAYMNMNAELSNSLLYSSAHSPSVAPVGYQLDRSASSSTLIERRVPPWQQVSSKYIQYESSNSICLNSPKSKKKVRDRSRSLGSVPSVQKNQHIMFGASCTSPKRDEPFNVGKLSPTQRSTSTRKDYRRQLSQGSYMKEEKAVKTPPSSSQTTTFSSMLNTSTILPFLDSYQHGSYLLPRSTSSLENSSMFSMQRNVNSECSGNVPISLEDYRKQGVGTSFQSSKFTNSTNDGNCVYQWDLQENIKLNKILNAIAKGCKKNSCFKVEDKLLRTISKFIQGECKAMPDISSFGIAINAWARRGERGSAERAEALLHRMTSLYDAKIILSKPDARMYTTVIGAWSRSHDEGRATRAEMLLNYMENRYKNGDFDVKPNVRTYGAVLHAFAKSGDDGAAERAQELLDRMERMYEKGDDDVKPNVITYNAVITAFAKSRDSGRAEKAEALLIRMQQLFEKGNLEVKPDVVTYNSVIDAWAKSGERGSAVHAEALLSRMQELYRTGCTELKPNEQTYDIVLNAWALSGEENAARRGEEILNHMENLYQQGKNTDVRPSTVSYSSVINAWARSGEDCAPYRAEQILRHMEKLYEEGNENLKPDKVLYIAVINAWGKCHEKEEANKRIEVLRDQIRLLSRERDRDRRSNGTSSNNHWKK